MSLDLEGLDEKEKPAERRVKDYASACSLFKKLRTSDTKKARDRDLVHRLIRGDPPRDQALMEEAGMGDFSNFNPLKAAADVDQAITTFVGLADATTNLITLKTRWGNEEQRNDWAKAIAEEYTWLLREGWGSFYDREETKALGLVSDGFALKYWPHSVDWRCEVGRPGQFLFPSNTTTDVAKWDVVCQIEYVSPTKLYQLLKKREEVVAKGDTSTINKDEVEDAIKAACAGTTQSTQDILDNFRDNDLCASYADSQEIGLVHYYVEEFSGKVSHLVGRVDCNGKDFLEVHNDAFDSMARCFVPYADGIGTGKISSLQGIIWRAYPAYYQDAELRNQAHDALRMASIMFIQSDKQSAQLREILAQLSFNPVTVLPAGLTVGNNGFNPTALNSLFPLLTENKTLIANNTGGYASHELSPEGGGRTAREVSLQAANSAQLGGAKIIRNYRADDAYHRETFRRLSREVYEQFQPGAQERNEFFRRLAERGVPPQAVFKAYGVKAVRAIGLGSPAAQQAALAKLASKRPFMDAKGQREFDRLDCSSSGTDYGTLDEILPALPDPRPTIGDRFALFEHDTFSRGSLIMPFEDDDPYIHIPIHLGFGNETLGMLQKGIIDPEQAVRQMGPWLQHLQAHFKMAQDPQRADQVKAWQKAFDQFGKTFQDLTQQVQTQKEQQAAAQQQQPAAQLTPEQQADQARQQAEFEAEQARLNAESQAEIQRKNLQAQTTADQRQQLHDQQVAHRDLNQANQILDSAAQPANTL